MSNDTALNDISYIRLALLDETLRRVEKLPYPGEIQTLISSRISLLRLSELLYSVCGGERLPQFTEENAEEQKKSKAAAPQEKSAEKNEPSAETKALMEFFGKAGGNMLRSAATQAVRTGRVDTDTAKRAAVSGIAQTISYMMREDRDK